MRQTTINGRWPIILPDHRADFHEERPWWEAARLSDMYAHLNSGDVVYDVGSEEGDLTALYATWGCDVIFFDPSHTWAMQTLEIFRANHLDPPFGFIGFAADTTDLKAHNDIGRNFARFEERPDISRITLGDFSTANSPQPSALTIDVEGDELAVLKGAEGLLAGDLKVWVSIHGDVDPHAATPSEVHAWMRGRGYTNDQFLAYDHEWHYRFERPF